MKRYIFIIIVSILCIPLGVFASDNTYMRTKDNLLVPSDVEVTEANLSEILTTPAVNATEKIYDFAQLLSYKEEQALLAKLQEYTQKTGLDLVIVTAVAVNDLNSLEYADRFYKYNDFANDGIILVVYVGSDIEVYMANQGESNGLAFETYTNSNIQVMTNRFTLDVSKKNDYYYAMTNYIKSLDRIYSEKYYGVEEEKLSRETLQWIVVSIAFSVSFITLAFLLYRNSKNNHIRNKRLFIGKIDKSTLEIKTEVDDFVGSNTVRRKK
ncbi:MAG: TPM domain-containing protein [Bacilli bacterium]|nr:TPM domain-containing protein [Bacilli bacterium]